MVVERNSSRSLVSFAADAVTGAEPSSETVPDTIKERLQHVVSYCTHGITNTAADGLNSKIMSIKRRVGGFRNIENFKTAIFFYCGGLQLYPR
jgi:transposase